MAALALIAMSVAMFLGTLIIGQLPLLFKMSPNGSKSLSLYGIGLLLGAAMTIVIPEGVDALYEAKQEQARAVGLSLVFGFLFMFLVDELQSHAHVHHSSRADAESATAFKERSHSFILARRISARGTLDCDKSPRASTEFQNRDEVNSPLLPPSKKSNVNGSVGGAAASRLPSAMSMERHHSAPVVEGLSPASYHQSQLSNNAKSHYDASPVIHGGKGSSSISTTIGLLVHSLADGISLGASAAATASSSYSAQSSGASLDVIVFIAIMVHKAPAAFGLATVLLGDGWGKTRIRMVLTAFSATAPLGAVITYFLLNGISHIFGKSNEADSLKYWTGLALLFSGGTFLFVATHIMQEADSPVSDDSEEEKKRRWRWLKPLLMILGMVTPLILQSIVGHSH